MLDTAWVRKKKGFHQYMVVKLKVEITLNLMKLTLL